MAKKQIKILEKWICPDCGRELTINITNFYQSFSPRHQGVQFEIKEKTQKKVKYRSFVPYCKDCIAKNIDLNNIETIKEALSLCDKPYLVEAWNSNLNKYKDKPISTIFGLYVKNLALNYKNLRYKDSESVIHTKTEVVQEFNLTQKPTQEMINRWGVSWTDDQYIRLDNFYNSMKVSNKNNIETAQDEDYLKKLVRLSIKIDDAIESGKSSEAKQLGDLYSKYMADSKFRATDMTDADKQGGIRTFSSIYKEVEKPDFIPPWKKYAKVLGVTQDLVDKAIMHIENFTLRFNKAERMTTPPTDTPQLEEE